VLVEAQDRGLDPRDNWEELMELIRLRKHIKDAEVACVTEAEQLEVLVQDISKVLVDLAMPPIRRIPEDPGRASDVLEAVGTVLECL
jgi:hypothetical protein